MIQFDCSIPAHELDSEQATAPVLCASGISAAQDSPHSATPFKMRGLLHTRIPLPPVTHAHFQLDAVPECHTARLRGSHAQPPRQSPLLGDGMSPSASRPSTRCGACCPRHHCRCRMRRPACAGLSLQCRHEQPDRNVTLTTQANSQEERLGDIWETGV